LEALDSKSLATLPLDSMLLQQAFEQLFLLDFEGLPPTWHTATKADLMRRGNSATPLLLKLFERPGKIDFREELLFEIEDFPTIDLLPYLEIARRLGTQSINTERPRTCYAITRLLTRRGTSADLEIVKAMSNHPVKEVAFVIEPDVKRMIKRLNGTLKPSEWTGRPPDGYDWPPPTMVAKSSPATKAPEADPQTLQPSEEPPLSTPWTIIIVLIVAATGLLWLLVKNRK
jgi:hypothetical protein